MSRKHTVAQSTYWQAHGGLARYIAEFGTSLFVLYDSRAAGGNTDDARVLCSARAEADVADDNRFFEGRGAVWVQYDINAQTGLLENERRRPDLDPK